MTKERFKLNLRYAVHEIKESIDAIDEHGYCENDYEDAHYCIFEALKNIKKAVLLYEKECDFITLD